jgi:hypothetical protein
MIFAGNIKVRGVERKEIPMTEEQDKPKTIRVENGGWIGSVWFIGWLFTIAYAGLDLFHALLALLVWPYYLGLALR